jgi:hypothetical protein
MLSHLALVDVSMKFPHLPIAPPLQQHSDFLAQQLVEIGIDLSSYRFAATKRIVASFFIKNYTKKSSYISVCLFCKT